jgi:hypothetical protein
MLVAGEQTSDVEAYGTERYQLAGLQLLQAIAEIENLNIDATGGLTFPSVIDKRSAENAGATAKANISYFTIGNMDDNASATPVDASFNTTDGNRLTFVAKPKWNGATIPNPFGSATVGDTFRIIKTDADTTKTAIGGSFLGLELAITDKDVMTSDADEPVDMTDEPPTDIPWRAGYYWMRTNLNMNKIYNSITSVSGAISAGDVTAMDLESEVLQMRQVGV